MITAAGTILGIAATPWLSPLLQALMPPGQLSLTLGTGLQVHVLLFTAGLCVLTTLAAGIVPAMVSGHTDLEFETERRRAQRSSGTWASSPALRAGCFRSRAGSRGSGLRGAAGAQLPANRPHRSGIRSEPCTAEPVLPGDQRLQSGTKKRFPGVSPRRWSRLRESRTSPTPTVCRWGLSPLVGGSAHRRLRAERLARI